MYKAKHTLIVDGIEFSKGKLYTKEQVKGLDLSSFDLVEAPAKVEEKEEEKKESAPTGDDKEGEEKEEKEAGEGADDLE